MEITTTYKDELASFDEYKLALPQWTQQLLTNTKIKTDKKEVLHLLTQEEELYLVTDSRTANGIGCF
eukprot:1149019-Ditylum_brightwellii.AAC.1